MKLKKFGADSMADSMADSAGYDLPLVVGWLEDMVSSEDESATAKGPKRKRVELVEDGLEKLRLAMEMGGE